MYVSGARHTQSLTPFSLTQYLNHNVFPRLTLNELPPGLPTPLLRCAGSETSRCLSKPCHCGAAVAVNGNLVKVRVNCLLVCAAFAAHHKFRRKTLRLSPPPHLVDLSCTVALRHVQLRSQLRSAFVWKNFDILPSRRTDSLQPPDLKPTTSCICLEYGVFGTVSQSITC
jgi:hypothetical protein